jgi:hypothetical protein
MDEFIREIAHTASGYAGSSLQLSVDDVNSFHCLSAIHQENRYTIRQSRQYRVCSNAVDAARVYAAHEILVVQHNGMTG